MLWSASSQRGHLDYERYKQARSGMAAAKASAAAKQAAAVAVARKPAVAGFRSFFRKEF